MGELGGDRYEAIDLHRGSRSLHTLWRVWLPAIVLIVVLCGGLAFQLQRTQTQGKSDLRERFALRTALTAGFTESFVTELRGREQAQAQAWLTDSLVPSTTFDQIAGSFGFSSAVLLDDRGRVIAVYPDDPTLIGTHLAARYAHLQRAVAGHAAISSVVRSASSTRSIVTSAVPFATAYGRRVFSGSFDIGQSPVGAYLRSSTSIPHSVFAIGDGAGDFVTGSPDGISPSTVRQFDGTTGHAGFVVAEHRVPGTPWTVDALVPANTLYAPLRHRNTLYWLILVAFGLACILALGLLYRLMRSKDAMRQLASVDPLTGVWNRRVLEDAYLHRGAQRARYGGTGALLLLDLDRFKQVNDDLGHARGDELLRDVVTTLRATLRSSDWIARIGGDEFAMLLPTAGPDETALVISKIAHAIAQLPPLDAEGRHRVGASIGRAFESDLPESLDALLARADESMYRDKLRAHAIAPVAVDV